MQDPPSTYVRVSTEREPSIVVASHEDDGTRPNSICVNGSNKSVEEASSNSITRYLITPCRRFLIILMFGALLPLFLCASIGWFTRGIVYCRNIALLPDTSNSSISQELSTFFGSTPTNLSAARHMALTMHVQRGISMNLLLTTSTLVLPSLTTHMSDNIARAQASALSPGTDDDPAAGTDARSYTIFTQASFMSYKCSALNASALFSDTVDVPGLTKSVSVIADILSPTSLTFHNFTGNYFSDMLLWLKAEPTSIEMINVSLYNGTTPANLSVITQGSIQATNITLGNVSLYVKDGDLSDCVCGRFQARVLGSISFHPRAHTGARVWLEPSASSRTALAAGATLEEALLAVALLDSVSIDALRYHSKSYRISFPLSIVARRLMDLLHECEACAAAGNCAADRMLNPEAPEVALKILLLNKWAFGVIEVTADTCVNSSSCTTNNIFCTLPLQTLRTFRINATHVGSLALSLTCPYPRVQLLARLSVFGGAPKHAVDRATYETNQTPVVVLAEVRSSGSIEFNLFNDLFVNTL